MKDFDKSFLYKLRLIFAYKDFLRNHGGKLSLSYFQKFRESQLQAAHKLRGKNVLDVAFFLTIPGMWKSDELFKAMLESPHYNPYVVIYPYSVYKEFSKSEIDSALKRTENFIQQKGYKYIIPYDNNTKKWMDIKEYCSPDIVFFSTPYKDSLPKYFIYNFKNTLTCYVPYGFSSLNMYHTNYDMVFHNLVGMHFVETTLHKKMATEHSRNHGANIYITGYPATEIFLRTDYQPKNQWKPELERLKKVIYAPHHSIDKADYPSVFLETCEGMLQVAEKFKDRIQFVFKPHQLLKFKLQQIWGIEKTEEYYHKWESLSNTQLISDGYVDLFFTSDAMIHDCGSFTTEYLFTKKPVMYLCRNTDMTNKFNEFGIESFNCHYHGTNIQDIENFLQDVVINDNDSMKEKRERFFDEYLKPKDGILPSKKILEVIENTINA